MKEVTNETWKLIAEDADSELRAFVLAFICVGTAKNNAAAKRAVNSSSAAEAVSTLIK